MRGYARGMTLRPDLFLNGCRVPLSARLRLIPSRLLPEYNVVNAGTTKRPRYSSRFSQEKGRPQPPFLAYCSALT
jgi:hypothetical protein